jgi:cytochrome b561
MEKTQYDITIRILHWAIAALIFTLIALGWWMSELPRTDANKLSYILLHKSLGISVLILIIGRVAMRLLTPIPPLPDSISASEQKLAKAGHFALYVFMFATPLSGYIMSMASGYGIEWLGIKLHNYIGVSLELAENMEEVHETLPYILLAVVGVHVAGYLKHRFFDSSKVDLLTRISLINSKS